MQASQPQADLWVLSLGAHWGGPLAAAGTTSLGIAVLGGARKMSTLGKKQDGTAKSIAMSIAKIERRGVPARRSVPNYWL